MSGSPAPLRLCPANNLTQSCTCDDGESGRQICIEASGWGGCDCGQETGMPMGDLKTAAMTPPANLDTSIAFEDYVMPSTLDGDCNPGTYIGTFECSYTGELTPEPFVATGLVSFVLTRAANSEVLSVEDGLLDGWGIMWFFAYLSGELNCGTGEFAGTADEGFYNPFLTGCSGARGDMPGTTCIISDKSDPDYEPWMPNLEGSYTGSLDPSTDTISGDWSLVPLDIGGSCDGTFTVMLVP